MSFKHLFSCFGTAHSRAGHGISDILPRARRKVMLSSKIPLKQPNPHFQVFEDDEDDCEVAGFLDQEPIAFSFTGIPMSRPRSQCQRRQETVRPTQEKGRLVRGSHGSMGSLSIEDSSTPRVDGSGDYDQRSRNRMAKRPPRSASSARLATRRDAAESKTTGEDRLSGFPLRQSLPFLRRSLSDLNSSLGVDPNQNKISATLEESHRRLEADWEAFRRQLSQESRPEAVRPTPKTAVVPPFAVTPPNATNSSTQEPMRPPTPSRIPVPQGSMRAPSPVAKTRRSMSVCQEGSEKASREKPPFERRGSCDIVKISTPLVTGRSSIVGTRSLNSTPGRAVNGSVSSSRRSRRSGRET